MSVTYEHLLKNNNKCIVDAAIRDGNGVKIDTNYLKNSIVDSTYALQLTNSKLNATIVANSDYTSLSDNAVIGKGTLDNQLDLKANSSDVYTKSATDTLLDAKADDSDITALASSTYATQLTSGALNTQVISNNDYTNLSDNAVIGKGTLDNSFYNKSQIDAQKNVQTVDSVTQMTDTTKCYILKVSGDTYYYDSSASKWVVAKGITANSWAEVQSNVRAGLGSAYTVGTQFTEERSGTEMTFDVLDYDVHTPADSDLSHTLCLGMHDCALYGSIPFDAPELLYYCPDGLVAGTYKLTTYKGTYGGGTQEDGTYVFTLTQDIPEGGGIRHTLIGGWASSYSKSRVLGGKFVSYGALPTRTQIEQVATAEWTSETATDLGTFSARETSYITDVKNSTERNAYGSNRYKDSAIRQWLNSSASTGWWTAQNDFDMPPSGASLAGFLYGFSDDFVNAMCPVKVRCALTNIDKVKLGVTYEDVEDKVWLQSSTEVFGTNPILAEGTRLAYWSAHSTDADRIKYYSGTARYWWLRSAVASYPRGAYNVTTSGARYDSNVNYTYGDVPACCIG